MKNKLAIIMTLALATGCFSESSNDKADGSGGGTGANGVFAKLVVGRMVYSAAAVKIDTMEALFSDTFDPCAVFSDLQPSGVACNAYTLNWNGDLYNYHEIPDPDGFLISGSAYTFTVTASAEVPVLSESIGFPGTEPSITSPGERDNISSGGFTANWSDSAGSGTVQIILLNVMTSEAVYVETTDDGSYDFNATQLSDISAGECYLQIEKYNQKNISAAGYDSRSIIRARNMCNTLINLN